MEVNSLSFGMINIDGIDYNKDLVIDHHSIIKREKSGSKKYKDIFGHTPLSPEENIPWQCKRLVIGTGHSMCMTVMQEVYNIASRKGVELLTCSTPEAVKHINDPNTNLILHLTC